LRAAKLIEIPRSLWITADTAPELAALDLEKFSACRVAGDFELVKEAALLFLESQKGSQSAWSSFVSSAPSLADYRSFMVLLADEAILQEFSGLGAFIQLLRNRRQQIDSKLACLDQVRDHVGGALSALTRDDGLRWLLVSLTRRYKVHDNTALIPIADMMNTANADSFNTHWHPERSGGTDTFVVDAQADANVELYDQYCSICHNGLLLLTWGIYLEGNQNPVPAGSWGSDCNLLRGPAEAVLDLQALMIPGGQGRLMWPRPKPRCVATDARRCNLANLAYEICGQVWSGNAVSLVAQAADEHHRASGLVDLERALHTLDHMAIGGASGIA
jgi:hypothetical protein